jgi:hypothetical protein
MDNSLQGVLEKMGNNFLVAAFVPAMAFIVISGFVFRPILPQVFLIYFNGDVTQFIQTSFIALLFITIIGFTLYALSTYIYKSFEGYTFILGANTFIRRAFLMRQARRYQNIEKQRTWIKEKLSKVNQKIVVESKAPPGSWRTKRYERYQRRRSYLESCHYSLTSEMNENFPPSRNLILPSRFGNILRAAEMYPGSRYGIDAVPVWGRLSHVIPDDGMIKIDQANNECLFLLNAALLASIFVFLCILAAAYQGVLLWARNNHAQLLYFISVDREPLIYQQRIGIYFFIAIVAAIVAWFFYEASLLNVSQYGSMIKTAYDLYRFNLLEAFHIELPDTLQAEKKLWKQLGKFMTGNDQLVTPKEIEMLEKYQQSMNIDFPYSHPEKQKTAG